MFWANLPAIHKVIINFILSFNSKKDARSNESINYEKLEDRINQFAKINNSGDIFLSIINEIYLDKDVMSIYDFKQTASNENLCLQYIATVENIVTLKLLNTHFESLSLLKSNEMGINPRNEDDTSSNTSQNKNNVFNNKFIQLIYEQRNYYHHALSRLNSKLNDLKNKSSVGYNATINENESENYCVIGDEIIKKYKSFLNDAIKLKNFNSKFYARKFIFFKYTELTEKVIDFLNKKLQNKKFNNKFKVFMKHNINELCTSEIQKLIDILKTFKTWWEGQKFKNKKDTYDANEVYKYNENDLALSIFDILLSDQNSLKSYINKRFSNNSNNLEETSLDHDINMPPNYRFLVIECLLNNSLINY